MASIVYYTNSKTGVITAYKSEAKWDPEKGYSVPKRTYLGRVDPVTREIIPSSGKRGRKKNEQTQDPDSYQAKYEAAVLELEKTRVSVSGLQKQIQAMEKERDETVQSMQKLQQQLGALISRLTQ